MWGMDVVTGAFECLVLSLWWGWEGKYGLAGGNPSMKVYPEDLKTSGTPCLFSPPGVSG